MTRRIVRMMDLTGDPAAIAAYDAAHSPGNTPPAVLESQRRHGIAELEIYRLGSRLVMVMDVTDAFDPDALDRDGATHPDIVAWHRRMGALQCPVPGAEPWAELPCVFRQSDHP